MMTITICSFQRSNSSRHHSFYSFIVGTFPKMSFNELVSLQALLHPRICGQK